VGGFALGCGKEQEIAIELSGNKGASKTLIVLADFQQSSEMPVFEVRPSVAFALKEFFDGRKLQRPLSQSRRVVA